jgi:DNA-binding NarL/FixJ family response regulator
MRAPAPFSPATGEQDVPDAPLPPRLLRVRVLLLRGLSNKRIASEMQISEGTVKNYMTELFRRLGVRNRTQAALTAGARA